MNQKKRDVFWETDLDDLRKQYLPKGANVSNLPLEEMDWRVPLQGSPLLAMGWTDDLPEDDGK